MDYKDISKEWTAQNEHLKIMSQPSTLLQFGIDRIQKKIQSQFKILSFMTQTQHHLQKIYKNPDQFPYNRYSHIMTFQPTRIKLDQEDTIQNYINGNIIDLNGHNIIATQGPLYTTFYNFWRMVEKFNSSCIIMLCSIIEKNKPKCDRYWPNQETQGGKIIQKCYEITLISQNMENGYKKRKFCLKNNNINTQKFIYHYQVINWPDTEKPPKSIQKAIRKLLYVIDEEFASKRAPIVHCSAGVGRTGTFIAMVLLRMMIKQEQPLSIFETVRKLKQQRWGMINTSSQYEYLYDFAEEEINRQLKKDKEINSDQEN